MTWILTDEGRELLLYTEDCLACPFYEKIMISRPLNIGRLLKKIAVWQDQPGYSNHASVVGSICYVHV